MTVPNTLTDLKIFFYRISGTTTLYDTHNLLGGRVNADINGVVEGLNVNLNGQTLSITSFYPMQRTTMSHIYLRSSLITDSYQNHHFDSGASAHDNYIYKFKSCPSTTKN